MRTILTLLTLMLLTACASSPDIKLYEGADLPAEQLLLVDVPMELEIVVINERKVDGINKLFSLGDRTLHLRPGNYRIIAYYKNLFELPGNNHEVVKSAPVLYRISGAAGSRYRLSFDEPADVDEAREMAKNFAGYSLNLATAEQHPTEASGMMMNQGFLTFQSAPEVASVSSVAPAADSGLSHIDLLKASWQNATAEERRAFLRWIAETPASPQ
jgi:uncharacterized protein